MIWTEIKNDTARVKEALDCELRHIYPESEKRGHVFFTSNHGEQFEIVPFAPPWKSIVISYEPSGEDGDRFFPEDYDSLEDLIKAMIDEIEEEY